MRTSLLRVRPNSYELGPPCAVRIDPDLGVFDWQAGAGLRALEVARADRRDRLEDLASLLIEAFFPSAEDHFRHAEIAKARAGGGIAESRGVAQELHVALGRQHAQPFANGMLAPEVGLIFEGLGELHCGVESAFGRLGIENVEDHVALALTLCVEAPANLLPNQTFAGSIDLHPAAIALVDELGRESRPVAQLDLQTAFAALLVRPVEQHPRG